MGRSSTQYWLVKNLSRQKARNGPMWASIRSRGNPVADIAMRASQPCQSSAWLAASWSSRWRAPYSRRTRAWRGRLSSTVESRSNATMARGAAARAVDEAMDEVLVAGRRALAAQAGAHEAARLRLQPASDREDLVPPPVVQLVFDNDGVQVDRGQRFLGGGDVGREADVPSARDVEGERAAPLLLVADHEDGEPDRGQGRFLGRARLLIALYHELPVGRRRDQTNAHAAADPVRAARQAARHDP